MKIDINGAKLDIESDVHLKQEARLWHETIMAEKKPYTGWANLPMNLDEAFFEKIEKTAKEINRRCDLLIVIGVGGSYLGAKAVIDALNGSVSGYPEVLFAGYNMSASHLNYVIKKLEEKNTCLCVISKSGSTLEPLLTYSILREKMREVYGDAGSKERIYVITSKDSGKLRQEVEEFGYPSFEVPDNVGGRFSVLSAVGLLPIAVAGHDIRALVNGAKDMALDSKWSDSLLDYAIVRHRMKAEGKKLEIFEYFEASLRYFGEWLKQLFAESEGKEGKGTYPSSLCFSTDLHSIGQFLQQGSQIFYETMIRIDNSKHDFIIPETAGEPYAGKTLEDINTCSEEGVIRAHMQAEIPMVIIQLNKLDEYNLGKMIYFFEMSCAISAYLLGVNPFDQPGVEDYKREAKKLVADLDKK